jgi:hypothetical protein
MISDVEASHVFGVSPLCSNFPSAREKQAVHDNARSTQSGQTEASCDSKRMESEGRRVQRELE